MPGRSRKLYVRPPSVGAGTGVRGRVPASAHRARRRLVGDQRVIGQTLEAQWLHPAVHRRVTVLSPACLQAPASRLCPPPSGGGRRYPNPAVVGANATGLSPTSMVPTTAKRGG